MDLHVVHPWTYRQEGETLHLGLLEKFKDRDEKASNLIKLVLGKAEVYFHYLATDPFNGLLAETSLEDDFYNILFDEKVKRVPSNEKGIPLSLEGIKLDGDLLFIGGLTERCLGNSMKVFSALLHKRTGIYYVPEICVSESKSELSRVEKEFKDMGIKSISYKEVLAKFEMSNI